MSGAKPRYERPRISDFGPIAAHTFETPPGSDDPVDHKGFHNCDTPDNSDCELSSTDGGPG